MKGRVIAMAQHYPIQSFFEYKRIKVIDKGIRSSFARTGRYGMRGSLRYLFNKGLTRLYNKPGLEIYSYRTKIPKSIYGGDYAVFEIHWNSFTNEIEHIYLPI